MPRVYNRENLDGLRFGRLVVLKRIGKVKGNQKALCLCDCGNITESIIGSLKRGTTQSCGCLQKEVVKSNKGINSHLWKGCGELSYSKWLAILWNAKNRKIKVDIDIKFIWDLFLIQNKKCALSGEHIGFEDNSASLDRIDSSKGYVQDNIQWVHKDVNKIKHILSVSELVHWCNLIVNPVLSSTEEEKENNKCYEIIDLSLPKKIKYNKLIIQKYWKYKNKSGHNIYMTTCKCICGNIINIRYQSLIDEKTKSCGCLQYKGFSDISSTFWEKIKRSSMRRNIDFNLSIKEAWDLFIYQKQRCALTNIPLIIKGRKNRNASLDRINCDKSYILDNVIWTHKIINVMRNNLSLYRFNELCYKIVNCHKNVSLL